MQVKVSKMAKSTEGRQSTRARARRRANVRFEATVNNDRVDVRATAPTKFLRVLLRVWVLLVIALILLKMPELWQAIQTAINLVPK